MLAEQLTSPNNPVLHRPVELAQYLAVRYTQCLHEVKSPVQAAVVEPVDVLRDGDLEVVDAVARRWSWRSVRFSAPARNRRWIP